MLLKWSVRPLLRGFLDDINLLVFYLIISQKFSRGSRCNWSLNTAKNALNWDGGINDREHGVCVCVCVCVMYCKRATLCTFTQTDTHTRHSRSTFKASPPLDRPVARLLLHGGHHDFLRGHLIIFLPVCELSHFISFLPRSPAPSHKRPTGCHFS